MTVYVDNARIPYRRMLMCHMIADTEAELHTIAQAVGIRRKWYQKNHYDVCLRMRDLAIELGAQEVTRRELVRILIDRRK